MIDTELVGAKRRILRLQKNDFGFSYETAIHITLREFNVTRENLENVLRDRWDLVKEYIRKGVTCENNNNNNA